ncbi:thioester domain-containing protein [Kutzneria sp. NPDC052558]|uniref:thioester domain-containing protein n=1 Tax=Kutzneria sp. NPDC052558 TaxID=3364121 RepID=UPI0037C6E950
MANRFHPGRIAAAVLGASIALMSAAPLAFAGDNDSHGGGYATPRGPRDQAPSAQSDAKIGTTTGLNVKLVGDKYATERTLLIPITVDGQKVYTYCVELNVDIDGKVKMVEVPWDKYPYEDAPGDTDGGFKKHAGQINWILQNSYPNVSAATLTDALTKAGVKLHNGLSEAEAISATQSAIWHLSDGAKLDESDPTPFSGKDAGADVLAAYNFLLAHATDLPQPTPSLDLTPPSLSGKAGDLIGPFTVTTTAGSVKVSSTLPNGVTLTDKDGKALGDVANGAQIYVKVPATADAGKGSFAVDASAHLNAGRLFVGANSDGTPSKKAISQSLIVAKPTDIKLHKEASVSWTVAPTSTTTTTTTTTTAPPTTTTTTPCVSSTTPTTTTSNGGGSTTTTSPAPTCATPTPTTSADTNELAYTGASVIGPAIAGVVLIGAGIGALFFVRRRKANHS